MKTFKVILGIIILIATIKTSFDVLPNEHGAGLGGAITGFLLLFIVSILLIYFGTKNENSETENIIKSKEDNSISNLTDLKDKGILTDEEYKEKVGKIESEKTEQDLKNSTEYKQLKSLMDSNILTKDEFENKIEVLKSEIDIKNNDYKIIDEFIEGFALVMNSNSKYGFIDEKYNIVIPLQFEYAESFKEGFSYVKYNGLFWNLDKNGKLHKPQNPF